MTRLVLVSLLIALCVNVPASYTSPQEKKQDAAIERLIAQLGSKDFAEREGASAALEKLGAPALEALRQAVASSQPEVCRRALALVARIERRLDTDQLLTPVRLRLDYRDTPMRDVVADLAKRTGFPIRLEGDATLAAKKITLQSPEQPFWQALASVCQQAALVERDPPLAEKQPNNMVITSIVIGGGAGKGITPKDVLKPATPERPSEIVLVPGSTRAVSAGQLGAIRVAAQRIKNGTPIELPLEVTPQPNLSVPKIIGVEVLEAVDDQGQHLKQLPRIVAPPAPQRPRGGVVIINGQVIGPEEPRPTGNDRHVTVQLQPGVKPAKRLKEVSGKVMLLVQAPAEPLVVIEQPRKAAGQVVKGAKAGMVRMIEVTKEADGTWKVRFEAEPPARTLSDGSAPPPPNQNIIINGQPLGTGMEDSLSAANFTLLDAKGQPFEALRAVNTGKRSGSAFEYEFIYRGKTETVEPARFVYADRRVVVLEVAFTLRDLPLP